MKEKNETIKTIATRRLKKKEPGFPACLSLYPGMPREIYYRGRLPDPDKPSIAIVGARMCSPYGRIQAFKFAKSFSEAGVQVISGMAYGIDSEGHKGAMEGPTPTFAVLGGSCDQCYPKGNLPLYNKILSKGGGILSEFPDGMAPREWSFPLRNRIISALSDVVLVVEARKKSGSLITAHYAMEQGKPVYAVPGSVNEELSMGCHQLIYDGAGIAYSPQAVLAEWGIKGEDEEEIRLPAGADLQKIYECLNSCPKNIDRISIQANLPVQKANALIQELIVKGFAGESSRGLYIKI